MNLHFFILQKFRIKKTCFIKLKKKFCRTHNYINFKIEKNPFSLNFSLSLAISIFTSCIIRKITINNIRFGCCHVTRLLF